MPRFKIEQDDDGHHVFMLADDGVVQAEWEHTRVFETELEARRAKRDLETAPYIDLRDWRPC